MAKESRKNGKLFILIIIVSILLIATGIILFFYFDKKLKDNISERNKYNQEYQEKDKTLKSKEEELEKLEEDLESFNHLSEKATELKKTYYSKIKELEDKILAGKSNHKIAYLTFDDGPYYNTWKVLDILDKYDIKATFFTTSINGQYCFDNKKEDCYKLYKEYVKRGHTIANHTYTHGIWRGLYSSADSFMNAVIKQEEQVKTQSGGYVTNIVRFPGGSSTAGKLKNSIVEQLRKRGYGWVDWSCENGDGQDIQNKNQAWSYLKSGLNDKIEVILLHDYNAVTTNMLPELIEYLQNNGYILLPLFYESNMINK